MSTIRPYPWPIDAGRPHIVVVNRWSERYAEYARYIDHAHHRVTYVTTNAGLASVPLNATQAVLVDRTDDAEAVRRSVRQLAARYGAPAGVVALAGADLLIGAQVRKDWDLPGLMPRDLTVFHDQHRMSRVVQKAGLPVVSPADLPGVDFGGGPLLVQEYRPEQLHHVDGVFDGMEVLTLRASRYVNTWLGFRSGTYLGSVEVDDPRLNEAIAAATQAYLAVLTSSPTVFHLEIFVDTDAGDPPRFRLLAVGARPGGGEIPFVWREVHGYDLMEAALRAQLGLNLPAVRPRPEPPGDHVAGWLLVPAPAARPCRVTMATPMVGREPGPYAEAVVQPGDIIPAAEAPDEHVSGRFRFRGPTSAAVEAAVIATAHHFHVAGDPLTVAKESR